MKGFFLKGSIAAATIAVLSGTMMSGTAFGAAGPSVVSWASSAGAQENSYLDTAAQNYANQMAFCNPSDLANCQVGIGSVPFASTEALPYYASSEAADLAQFQSNAAKGAGWFFGTGEAANGSGTVFAVVIWAQTPDGRVSSTPPVVSPTVPTTVPATGPAAPAKTITKTIVKTIVKAAKPIVVTRTVYVPVTHVVRVPAATSPKAPVPTTVPVGTAHTVHTIAPTSSRNFNVRSLAIWGVALLGALYLFGGKRRSTKSQPKHARTRS